MVNTLISPRRDTVLTANTYTVADLYIAVLDNLLAGKQIGHGREGMYFGENGEYNSYELSRAIGETMVRLGKSKSAEPTTFSTEEEQMFFGVSCERRILLFQQPC